MFAAADISVLGFIAFYANDRKSKISYITQIAIKPKSQNKHTGKELLDLCIEGREGIGLDS